MRDGDTQASTRADGKAPQRGTAAHQVLLQRPSGPGKQRPLQEQLCWRAPNRQGPTQVPQRSRARDALPLQRTGRRKRLLRCFLCIIQGRGETSAQRHGRARQDVGVSHAPACASTHLLSSARTELPPPTQPLPSLELLRSRFCEPGAARADSHPSCWHREQPPPQHPPPSSVFAHGLLS